MKRYSIFILSAAITLASCTKSLDTVPQDFISNANFFNNATEIELAMNGVYEVLFSGNPYQHGYNEYYKHAFLGTDESTSNQLASSSTYPTHYNETSASTYVGGWWGTLFTGVNRANLVIENLDKSTAISEVERSVYKGEAKFLRAHYLFLLTQWYGNIPLRKHSVISKEDSQVPFSTPKEVYDFIISEMTEAQELLKYRKANSINYNEKVTQTTVQGMLARVCLHAAGTPVNDTKRYAEASNWAQTVITSNLHKLNPDYQDVFINHSANLQDNVNRETMWQLSSATGLAGVTTREQWIPRTGIFANTGIMGTVSGYERTNPRAYYTYTDGDLRRDWNIAPFTVGSAAATAVNPLIYYSASTSKWNREPGKWRRYYEPHTSFPGITSVQGMPLLRYADVLLMFAEAENYVNEPTSVGKIAGITPVDAVNLVRRRGYGDLKGSKGLGSITITNPGSGYTTKPPVNLVGGTRATRNKTIAGRPYLTENPLIDIVFSGGQITNARIYVTGDGYISLPTVVFGKPWAASTAFLANDQVVSGANLYTVTVAGTSGAVAPTNTSGSFVSGTATFTYAGVAATATVQFANADLPTSAYVSKDVFLKTIQDERLRELAFENIRRQDLKRWGILVETVQRTGQEAVSGSAELNADGTQWYGPYTAPGTSGVYNANILIFITGPNRISEKNIFLPIPLSEIVNNKYAKQNPGF